MKLRKNQTISPKNFFVPPREMKNIHGRNPQIAPEKSKSSRIKAIRVTICRDARSCVRCIKCYSVGLLSVSVGSTTDARPCVPTNRYPSSCYTLGCYCIMALTGTDARPCVPTNRYTSSCYTLGRYTSGCYTSSRRLMWCGI